MPTLQHANGALGCALTPREHQITSLVSAGFSNNEIARWLNLTEATVKTHLHNIYRKARVQNRTALAARYRASRQANGPRP
jgi:DNA-binding NarL/FixJ family response regulator